MATDERDFAGSGARGVDEMVTALNDANRDLIGATTKADVAEVVSEAATEVLDFPGTGMRLYDPDRNALVHQTFGSTVEDIETRPPYDVDSSPHGRAFTSGQTVINDIGETDPYDREAFTQTMYVPVGEYGILSAGKTDGAFTQTEVRIAETLAHNARVAFDRAVERRDLERSLERLRRQNERLEELSRLLTHDIRNPLNVAKGNVEVLDGEYDHHCLDDVRRAVERIDHLVDDVLTLLSEDRSVNERERVVLGRLVERCWQTVDTGTATLEVECDATLQADPSRLRHVFENLFRNAVEHGATSSRPRIDDCVGRAARGEPASPESGRDHAESLTVRVGMTDDAIYVEDDGAGIPPEERSRVFESGYTTARDGTGFGLSIVRDMVEAHGWTVTVTDGQNGGARFEITGDETGVSVRR